MSTHQGRQRLNKAVVLTVLGCLSFGLSAEVYQWTDAQGRVHFGDRPPQAAKARELRIQQPQKLNADGENHAARMEELDNFFQRRQDERKKQEQVAAEQQAKQAERQAACQRMLAQLRHMERVSVFYELNDKGERVFLDDEAGDRYRQEYRQKYDKHCG